MKSFGLFAGIVWPVLAGACLADAPARTEWPPFAVADTSKKAGVQGGLESLTVGKAKMSPKSVISAYRGLHRLAVEAYGPDAFEPHAILDRIAGYHGDNAVMADSRYILAAHDPKAAEESRQAMLVAYRTAIDSLTRSKVADWWKRGMIAKHEGAIALSEGKLDAARASFDAAEKAFSKDTFVTSYELVFVLTYQIIIAAKQARWDDAEAACDRLFRVAREKDARSFESVSLDVLETAEALRGYYVAYCIARRRGKQTGKVSRYAEWNLNAKVHRREVFGRRLADLKDARSGREADIWKELHKSWDMLALLGVQPAILDGPPERAKAMKKGQADAIRKHLFSAKYQAQEAGRIAVDRAGAADDWLTIDKVRAALSPDSVLIDQVSVLDYDFDGPPSIHWKGVVQIAFVIPPAGKGDVRLVELGNDDDIVRAVDTYVRVVRLPPSDDAGTLRATGEIAARATRALSKVLLDPLLPHVKDSRRWIISPQSLTWLVPWSTLVEPDGTPVVERHATSYVQAGRHVARPPRPRAPATKPGPPLIIAAPDYGPDLRRNPDVPFAPLPATADEARAIAPHLKAYAGAEPRILLGAQATEGALYQSPPPSVLVASTHGYYGRLPDAPVAINSPMLRCGLAFAGGNRRQGPPDGVATGLEILASDFRGTDLVVLSACQTSYGEVQATQGMIGLNLAFHLAGARTVLGALWPVPVDETTELTTGFFDELARGTPSDEALRRSQVALLKRLRNQPGGAHPAFWAGFVLSGETLTRPPR